MVNDTGNHGQAGALPAGRAAERGVVESPGAGMVQGPGNRWARQWGGVDHERIRSDVRAQCGDAAGGGRTVIFPYLATIYTLDGGVDRRQLLGGVYGAHAEREPAAGRRMRRRNGLPASSVQNLATAIGSGTCPTSITLSNNINPVAG